MDAVFVNVLEALFKKSLDYARQQNLGVCLSFLCLGGWVNQFGVEHLPAATVKVPRGTWRVQTQRVIPLSMRGLFGP